MLHEPLFLLPFLIAFLFRDSTKSSVLFNVIQVRNIKILCLEGVSKIVISELQFVKPI